MKKIWKKIKSFAGFSLTEMLTTVLIMSIVLAGITAGVTTAMRVYRQIKLAANAQTLLSTAITAINMDLRSASDIQETGDTVNSFTSRSRGYRMFYQSENNNIYIHPSEEGTSQQPVPLVTEKTKTGDLKISISGLTFIKPTKANGIRTGGDYFTYTISVEPSSSAYKMSKIERKICVHPMSDGM